jgi:LacI family transcriptional regulator
MTTIRDVAKLAGVSTATVSATLSGRAFVSDTLRARVLHAVETLGYAPDPMARSLKGGVTRLIGLVIPDITNPFYTELAHYLQERARSEGHSVLLCVTENDIGRESAALGLLRGYRADGVVICPAAQSASYAAQTFVPVGAMVIVDSAPAFLPFDTVAIDNEEAGRMAARHLLSLGHRRIGMIAGPQHLLTGAARLTGFRAQLAEAGAPLDLALLRNADFTQETAYHECVDLLSRDERPTAIFVANNTMLIGVMRAISDADMLCPEDISIIAIDDFDWAGAFRPRLTVIRQPVAAIAETAFALLQRRIIDRDVVPEHKILPIELVIRESCRRLNSTNSHP